MTTTTTRNGRRPGRPPIAAGSRRLTIALTLAPADAAWLEREAERVGSRAEALRRLIERARTRGKRRKG